MLKLYRLPEIQFQTCQPPSGGCVLKLQYQILAFPAFAPAAFGRLCVETQAEVVEVERLAPAAFGRLCVETITIFF